LRQCSSGKCLWNGNCTDIINGTSYDFECKCPYPYFGRYCHLKINLCQNKTYSNQGACKINDTTPYCSCYTGYQGENCDQMNQELQTIKMISTISGNKKKKKKKPAEKQQEKKKTYEDYAPNPE